MKIIEFRFYKPSEKMPENYKKIILIMKDGSTVFAEYNKRCTNPLTLANFGTIGTYSFDFDEVDMWGEK